MHACYSMMILHLPRKDYSSNLCADLELLEALQELELATRG